MFDAIGVSERTRKPWTVAASFAGQAAMIGLAVLVPLVSTEALPHGRLAGFLLSEPPPGRPPRPPEAARIKAVKPIPFQMNTAALLAPVRVPERVATIVDPDFNPVAGGDSIGVPYGTGGPAAGGNRVIEGLARNLPVPRPAPPAVSEPEKPAIQRIVVGGQVQQGKLISGPLPVYPALAKQARIAGTVLLKAVIARDGTIMDLHAVSGHPLLIPAAIAAVRQWVFQPTILNGDPVEVATEITVTFTLRQ